MHSARQIGWKSRLAPCQFRQRQKEGTQDSARSDNTRNSKAKRKQRRGKQKKITCSNSARNRTMQTTRSQKHYQRWPPPYVPSVIYYEEGRQRSPPMKPGFESEARVCGDLQRPALMGENKSTVGRSNARQQEIYFEEGTERVGQQGDSTALHDNNTGMDGVEERELQEGRKNMFINVPPPT